MIWASGMAAAAIVLVALRVFGNVRSNRERRFSRHLREASRFAAWLIAAASFGILIGQEDSLLSGSVVAMLVVVAGVAEWSLASTST